MYQGIGLPSLSSQTFSSIVLAIAKSLEMKYKMATDMQKALSGVGAKLKSAIGKKRKKSKTTAESSTPSAAKLFLAERKASVGGSDGTTGSVASSSSGAGSSSSDISDIL